MPVGIDVFHCRNETGCTEYVRPEIFILSFYEVIAVASCQFIKGGCAFCTDHRVHDVEWIDRQIRKLCCSNLCAGGTQCFDYLPLQSGGGKVFEIVLRECDLQ